MKNVFRVLGIVALVAVIGFGLVACDNGSTTTTYSVTVNGGSGSGSYSSGTTVTISATAQSGQTFINWTVNSGGAILANANNANTTFTMPANNVTVTANFIGGGGLTSDIDTALAGTSWKDNINGNTITISFTNDGITWGGTAGSQLNSVTSAYQGTGYTFVWIAKNGTISYKYSYNGGTVQTVPVYTYTLNSNTLELQSGGYTFATLVPDNSGGQNPGGGGLASDIDTALAGTSWKDNATGNLITISFADDSITWGGTAGSQLNSVTSAYQGTGYSFVWIAKNGTISYKYSYNGGTAQTIPVYTYTLNGNTLELQSSGYTFATLVPDNSGGQNPGGGGLASDIDTVLAGTSWKDNVTGNVITISFTADGITWDGTAGNQLNSVTSAYQGNGYTFVWVAKNGTISYKYSYNGGTVQTVPVYTYTLNGDTLQLAASGVTFATLIPADGGGQNPGGGGNNIDYTAPSISALATWLTSQSANTATTPYHIALTINNASDFTALKTTLKNNVNKYVYLDLSGSAITTIPDDAFYNGYNDDDGCKTLTGITMPNSVISIEGRSYVGAFRGCSNLSIVIFPSNANFTSIGEGAFLDCTSITNVTIPTSVTSLGVCAFANCTSLTSAIIPASVTSIGHYAFSNCSSLASVTFATGSNITTFGIEVFPEGSSGAGGSNLQNVYSAANPKAGTYTRASGGSTWTKQP